jgi:serine/threonine protein kinase
MKFFASLFKRDELQRRGITIDEEVGHGTYSKVYKGRLRRSEEEQIPIAIKIIDIKTSPVDFIKRFLPREINISKLVNHSNLLTTISDFETNGKHYIVTELARFDLLQYLRLKGK